MNIMDRLSKIEEREEQQARKRESFGERVKGRWMNWEWGDNQIRLVDGWIEIRQCYIAPSQAMGTKGLCSQDAFSGQNALPYFVNCSDWDIEKESWKNVSQCPIRNINKFARKLVNDFQSREKQGETLDDQDREDFAFFQELVQASRIGKKYVWPIISRDNPNVIYVSEDGSEREDLGIRFATMGPEAFQEVSGIFKQIGGDITDPEKGLDIIIKKSKDGRVSYSADIVLEGEGVDKRILVTPLSDKEKALEIPDLNAIYNSERYSVDPQRLVDAMHPKYREFYLANMEFESMNGVGDTPETKAVADNSDDEDALVGSKKN